MIRGLCYFVGAFGYITIGMMLLARLGSLKMTPTVKWSAIDCMIGVTTLVLWPLILVIGVLIGIPTGIYEAIRRKP